MLADVPLERMEVEVRETIMESELGEERRGWVT